MTLTQAELEYLSAWAREEREPDCWSRPAHLLQARHGIAGSTIIPLIKSWVRCEGKQDMDIYSAASVAHPVWPWPSEEALAARLAELVPPVLAGRNR